MVGMMKGAFSVPSVDLGVFYPVFEEVANNPARCDEIGREMLSIKRITDKLTLLLTI